MCQSTITFTKEIPPYGQHVNVTETVGEIADIMLQASMNGSSVVTFHNASGKINIPVNLIEAFSTYFA